MKVADEAENRAPQAEERVEETNKRVEELLLELENEWERESKAKQRRECEAWRRKG